MIRLALRSILPAVLCLVMALASPVRADTFAAGSYILPSDTTHQDSGGLLVYGLLYDLLLNNVPVRWTILAGKAKDDIDFSATTVPVGGGATALRSYAGGPFVVDSVDAAAALPVITAFQLAHSTVAVHEATATFTADVDRTMVAAPPIAVAVDGEEDIVFGFLNAAAIPDSAGQPWPAAIDGSGVYAGYPDIFTPTELAGTLASPNDGALFTTNGIPKYGELDFMHTDASTVVPGLADELRSFLTGEFNHIFLECKSIQSMEDNPTVSLLTTSGINDGGDPGTLSYAHQDLPIAQHFGAFESDGGSIRTVELDSGSSYDPNVNVVVKSAAEPEGEEDVLVFGHMDGNTANGWVTFMGGHNYTTTVPLSANPKTTGVRFYLNGLFITHMILGPTQPTWTLSTTGPATTLVGTVTFTINWSTGPNGQSLNAVLLDTIPAGSTFVSASGGGSYNGATGEVSWVLGALASNSSGVETVTVTLPAPGSYVNTATATYTAGLTPKTVSAVSTTTVFDTDADGDGFGSLVDCNDNNATVYPGASELCDGLDNDCDGVVPGTEIDDDGDGQTECVGDCDDTVATTYLFAPELCNGVDDNCDGVVPLTEIDNDGDGQTECAGDCDDTVATTYLFAPELCNAVDDNCDGVVPGTEIDDDGDGQTECVGDCDDTVATTYLFAPELCNGVDDDCDGVIDEGFDLDGIGGSDCVDDDGDGLTEDQGDCDDANNTVYPGAAELCDGIDNDCDGLTETSVDLDGDGVTPCDGDCDDTNPTTYPGALEICGNGIDDNCDGFADDNSDFDGDGVMVCAGDCDDTNATVYPNAPELCDNLDNDCDGLVDEGDDLDGDGFSVCQGDCDDNDATAYPGAAEDCTDGVDNDCDGVIDESEDLDNDGVTTCDGDCDDNDSTVSPSAPELCDGIDNDCNGVIDDGWDVDGDGFTSCGGDCDDGDASVYPGAFEDCTDGIDNDCDGLIDEDQDLDGDGYGTCLGLDCDDTEALANPGMAELCDGIDNDCDGVIDEGCAGDDDDDDDDDDDSAPGDDDDDDDDDSAPGDDDDDDDDDDSAPGDDDDDSAGDDDDVGGDDDDVGGDDDDIRPDDATYATGGGCSCPSTMAGDASLAWLLLLGIPTIARRRRAAPSRD